MPTSKKEINWLIHTLTRQIPLGQAMQLSIAELNEHHISLHAPLNPNVNDKGTAFGGALVSMMILAGWSLPRLVLRRHDLKAELVISRCEVQFLKPVHGDFQARCRWPEAEAVESFVANFHATGKGRIELMPEIYAGEELAARLSARYAAIP